MTPREVYDERLAIALEAGVPEARAAQVAECEMLLRKAREMRLPRRCECGAGHAEVRV